jgi:type II secretory pathway pseudopilin PulG
VVIAIIGILSGLIVVSMNGVTASANDARRKADISTISKALMVYGTVNGMVYPIQPTQCDIAPAGVTNRCANFDKLSDLLPVLPVDPNGTYYKYFSNSAGSTFTVSAVLSNEQFAVGPVQQCPVNWIDSGHGFCVMQYEARAGAISTGTGLPSGCSTSQARDACVALGSGYHLITNAEWTILARDIESVNSNWTGGAVGSGIIKRGNVGITDAGSYDGSLPETGSSPLSTLYLSNGQAIYHLSGNLAEYTSDVCSVGSGQGLWYGPNGTAREWNDSNLSDYEKNVAGPIKNYTSANGAGMFYGCGANGYVLTRGGGRYWGNTGTGAGVFSLFMVFSWDCGTGATIGYRCAR